MRVGEGEEELSRARFCAASRILTSVVSFLWRATTREDRTAYSYRRRGQGGRGPFRIAQ